MEIIKIIGIALIALIIIIMLKQYRPEYAIFISILTGILILFLVMDKLTGIIQLIQNIEDKFSINTQFIAGIWLDFFPMFTKPVLHDLMWQVYFVMEIKISDILDG